MKKMRFAMVLIPVFIVSAIALFLHPWRQMTVLSTAGQGSALLILDAGHGGEDGGAVSLYGDKESDINLAITLKMEQILAFLGQPPQLLRREDISLHDPSAATLREKKASDLKNRAEAVCATEGAVLISIHQNTFAESKYQGAQVFYAPTVMSAELAEGIQQVLIQVLQPENTRSAKPIPEQVYLMQHIDCPAVLVECGFLSNPEEARLLTESGYQNKIAMVLSAAAAAAADKIPSGL